MDKSEIHMNQQREDRQLKGLQDKGIREIKCADCGESLLCLQLTDIKDGERSQVITRVVVKCLCDGYSHVEQVFGQFHPGAPSDQMAFDVLDNDTDAPEADIIFKAWRK